ncbi:MAG TPA: T9SS type A sorting domain-containing protein [Chitinophagaceae bacterium]|nr:T9SS type A sorting domain-containing protein [Chitinophagaceae bacterium]
MRIKSTLITALLFFVTCFNASSQSQWSKSTPPPNGSIRALAVIGTNIFAGSSFGVYFSADDGATWTQRNGNLPTVDVYSLVTNGSDIFIGTGGPNGTGLYKSNDLGITWDDITPVGMFDGNVSVLAFDGTNIYVSSDWFIDNVAGHIFISPVIGIDSSSWTDFTAGFPLGTAVRSLKVHGANIYACTYGQGVWVSPISTPAWTSTSGMETYGDYISTISFNGTTSFAGNLSGLPVLYRSTDNGMTWEQSSTSVFEDKPVYVIINDQATVYAGTELNGMMMSTDNGVTWATFNEGFKDSSGQWYCNNINIRALIFKGNSIFAGTDCGVWKRERPVMPPVTPPVVVVTPDSLCTAFPNPARTTFTLKVGRDYIGSTFIVKDASGNVLMQKQITNEAMPVEISQLAAGVYYIQVGNQNKRTIKLMKK